MEHHQFHYDALSKPGLGTILFTKEQRQIRNDVHTKVETPATTQFLAPNNTSNPNPKPCGGGGRS
jgi:hypothetical protein